MNLRKSPGIIVSFHVERDTLLTGAQAQAIVGIESDPPELAISHWWRFADLTAPFTTTDGRVVHIVFRGIWSHGSGPDFRDAMIAFENAELYTGSIEIHRSASEWFRHGHDRDPTYNSVVLHVVLTDDGPLALRADGKIIPTVIIPSAGIDRDSYGDGRWSLVGGNVCAAHIAERDPDAIRQVVHDLGDQRLGQKSARIEGSLTQHEPGEVLYREVMETLGYSANREPMRRIARMLPLHSLDALLATATPADRAHLLIAAMLGTGGFLPLSPSLQDAAGLDANDLATIEQLWNSRCTPWHDLQLRPTEWKLARVRPANHPVRRLMAGALIIAGAESGLLFELLERVRAKESVEEAFTGWAIWGNVRLLGDGRARAITTNAVIPFAMALAAHTGNDALADDVASAWESLAGEEPNQASRRAQRQIAGAVRLRAWGARGIQGLLHLDSTLCAPRRCFECPIAHLVLNDDAAQTDPGPPT